MTPEQCRDLLDRGILQAFAEGRLLQRVEYDPGKTMVQKVGHIVGPIVPTNELLTIIHREPDTSDCEQPVEVSNDEKDWHVSILKAVLEPGSPARFIVDGHKFGLDFDVAFDHARMADGSRTL